MKIVIDGRMLNESGIGRYIRNLVANLQNIDKENEYLILLLKRDFQELEFKENFNKLEADFFWYGLKEQMKLPSLLNSLNADLVHFPHFNAPVFYKGKFIVTIHDLIHQHFSMERSTTHGVAMHKIKKIGYKIVFKNALSKSSKIMVPSNFVKNQLINDWKTDSSKIIVTEEGVDDNLISIRDKINEKSEEKFFKKFNLKTPYIFYVGNAHPHKNLEMLIKAFLVLQKKYKELSLVLSGNDHYFWKRLRKENQYEKIVYTGFVSDEELAVLYKNAKVFVLPSKEEGFGIPILEAMAYSCPVVSSDAGSLPEVGNDAGIFFDPGSLSDMVEKISKVLDEENLRKELIEKGLKRYKDFSWQKMTEKTLEVYKECA